MGTATAVKERPILFSGPMVSAILRGEKTQTRRIIKGVFDIPAFGPCIKDWDGLPSSLAMAPDDWEVCPHGVPGDRLWVRETWGLLDTQPSDGPEHATIGYRADGPSNAPNGRHQLWRSSIFMPRWASRITLEITGVRVERAQEMSEEDALADGGWTYANCPFHKAPVHSFADLWDSINAKRGYPWESNPWVWALSFRRVEPRS